MNQQLQSLALRLAGTYLRPAMSQGELLVIGHRNPDTDSICSAIGYAEFKRRTGSPHAVAARCGDTNERIDFVLQTFGVPPPRFVADVSPRVKDVMAGHLVSVRPEATLLEALGIMEEKAIRVLPILDEEQRCKGLVSVFKVSKFFCPAPDRVYESRKVRARLEILARTLGAKVMHMSRGDIEEELVMVIGAMAPDTFAQRLAQFAPERLLVVVGNREEIQEQAVEARVRALIVTGGLEVAGRLCRRAQDNGVTLLISPDDTATTASLCRASVAVRHMAHEEFLTFREEERLEEVRGLATASSFQAFPVLNDRDAMVGILSKSDFLRKPTRQLILVDHNELAQAVQGANEVEIIEIIDHHRIGSVKTSQPILFRNEPIGSTSSIVADCFFREQVELPRPIAGLLLAGLISDTLNLTSPTTTQRDAQILKRLEAIAEVDASVFTEKLFASGSVLTSLPAAQAVVADCKEFEEQGRAFSVAQIEELGFDHFWQRKQEVKQALEAYRERKDHYFSALLVTDVVRNTSLLLIAGPPAFLRRIDYPVREAGVYELAEVVSRKKQLVPYLVHCLRSG